MSNCYTDITATESIKATTEEAAAIFRALLGETQPEKDDRDVASGTHEDSAFAAEYYPDGDLYFFAEDNGDIDQIPDDAIKVVGSILHRLQKPYLEFGYAFRSDRHTPGSHGGGTFRITDQGTLVHPAVLW